MNNGGPAFPSRDSVSRLSNFEGMTLRDYFAAKIVAAMLSTQDSEQMKSCLQFCKREGLEPAQAFAMGAYKQADALLAERSKEKV